MLVADCAQGQTKRKPEQIAMSDVRWVYFYALATLPPYIEILEEDGDEDNEEHGTRVAASVCAAYASL